MPAVAVYVVGTAGSGKSTFVGSFAEWAASANFDVLTVNLDPGAEDVPYNPDIDIRDSIRLIDIMKEHQLGPNGAQIVAADMLALETDRLRELIENDGAAIALIDTPGQIELFAFRSASQQIVSTVTEHAALLQLFDPMLSRTGPGFVSQLMLAATVQFRFQTAFIPVLSKADLLPDDEVEQIRKWSESGESLFDALDLSTPAAEAPIPEAKRTGPGKPHAMTAQLARELLKVYESLGVYRNLIPVSSQTPFGFEDVYSALRLVFFGGEDPDPIGAGQKM
ncbi:MAG TPA: ATP/GTP-binding protein [Thermoplasmata archaeon]|nr:ATP/GTP-binding protein [Thermoplasmata archaeon]